MADAIAGNCLNGTEIVEKIVFSTTLLRIRFLVFMNWANKFGRFVEFGTDQDCYCGAVGCRSKLGVKANKPKMPPSDAALKLVACQVAASSPKVKAMLFGRNVCYCGLFSSQVLGYEVALNFALDTSVASGCVLLARTLLFVLAAQ